MSVVCVCKPLHRWTSFMNRTAILRVINYPEWQEANHNGFQFCYQWQYVAKQFIKTAWKSCTRRKILLSVAEVLSLSICDIPQTTWRFCIIFIPNNNAFQTAHNSLWRGTVNAFQKRRPSCMNFAWVFSRQQSAQSIRSSGLFSRLSCN